MLPNFVYSSEYSRMRIHVATFDADEGDSSQKYNKENCISSASLFQNQPGVIVKYWCEEGRYHK